MELSIEQWKTILEALEIAASWHKGEKKFLTLSKLIKNQVTAQAAS